MGGVDDMRIKAVSIINSKRLLAFDVIKFFYDQGKLFPAHRENHIVFPALDNELKNSST